MPLLDAATPALGLTGCDSVEVGLECSDSALTRFADSRIHQNVARRDAQIRVRVVVDGNRIGVASTNSLAESDVRRTAEQAREIARSSPPDRTFAGLAPAGADYAAAGLDDPATGECSPDGRVRVVQAMLAELPQGVDGAGYVQTQRTESAFASTAGVAVEHAGTYAIADLLASEPGSTGHAETAHSRLSDVDGALIGARAARGVRLGRDPRDVAPGSWTVVLEPGASAVLVDFLATMAFSGKDVNDGQSAFAGHLGEQLCSPAVTIVDDPLTPLLPALPFDAEGTSAHRLAFLDRGVVTGVAHDRATAREAGTSSTGHALPPPNPWGPRPWHLLMAPGAATLEELVAGCERGLYVSRFHYTNVVHPTQTTITGMTRNGTFLIEDGRIVAAVRDLRFTQSVLAALSTVDDIGREVEVVSDAFSGSTAAPPLRLGAFTFTSGTS